jgi:hypothetical protein
MIKGECATCFEYSRRTGRTRPKRLWGKDLVCRNPNCRIPLEFVTRKRGWYCGQCDWYLKKYERDRPAYLCRPGENHLGWCDCGNVARQKMSVTIDGLKRDLLLCQICYSYEQDIENEH